MCLLCKKAHFVFSFVAFTLLMQRQNSIQRSSPSDEPQLNKQGPLTTEETLAKSHPAPNNNAIPVHLRLRQCAYIVVKWHMKECPESWTLIVYRAISIILFIFASIVDTVAYAASSNPPSTALQFMWGAMYPIYEIATVIYCSGAAVFGISFEIYIFGLLALVNVILQSKNCGDPQLTAVFLVRVICLGIAVELAYRNFQRFCHEYKPRRRSSLVMLQQARLFSLSILFFAAPGLRAVYDGALGKCEFQYFTCGLIDLDTPAFEAHASCDPVFVEYVSSREELRIVRDWLLLNIAFYAIFNRALLDFSALITARIWWFLARLIILILFLALATSFLAVNISPFQRHKTKIIFDIIECALFVCSVFLMIYNLIRTRRGLTIEGNNEALQQEPHILPEH